MPESKLIELSKLKCNTGQIPGLPENPRFIKDERFEKLVKSIQDDPEMLELRELLVFPYNNYYVVIAGNMRLRAMTELGYKEAPCKVIHPETPVEKLRAIAVKDNIPFGQHDFELLASQWEFDELLDFGFEKWEFGVGEEEGCDEFELPAGDREPFQKITFILSDQQANLIKQSLSEAKKREDFNYCETYGNENSNGNALYFIVSQWAGQRK